MIETKKTAFV